MKASYAQPAWQRTIFLIGVYLQLLLSSRPRYHPSSARISKADLSFGTFHVFLLKRLHQVSTQITVAAWIRGFPQIMIVENAESIELAITFTAHSMDSDNKVSSSEKENYTHGALCSFPSVGI